MNFTYVECLLYTFHHLAQKVNRSFLILHFFCFTSQNYTFIPIPQLFDRHLMRLIVYVVTTLWLGNLQIGLGRTSLISIKISQSGDFHFHLILSFSIFSNYYSLFNYTERKNIVECHRLKCVEDLVRATIKKLTQGIAEHSKALAAAGSDEAKASIVSYLDYNVLK